MLGDDIQIKQLVGVGDVHLSFQPDQRVYCLIGENGIGKTKCLEALFKAGLAYNEQYISRSLLISIDANRGYQELRTNNIPIQKQELVTEKSGSLFKGILNDHRNLVNKAFKGMNDHNLPVVFLGAQDRGGINNKQKTEKEYLKSYSDDGIGSKRQRINEYFDMINQHIEHRNLNNLNMNIDIEKWVSQRARSANPYQAIEDNREVEITTLLNLLNKVDARIDSKFLEISGNNRVFIKVSDKKTELSELSSGFASILKIMQSIIAGYSYFTNETNIAHVKGVVFIDEIESHLHTKWQATIIPTLKRLFPNTTFYITTHSAIVLSQLQHGEAYELYRDKEDGIVKTELIEHPNNAAFVDLLKDAFDIDINRLKLSRDNAPQQKNAKKMLSELLEKRINELKEGTQ
ncbi:AAA family ATPase [Psychrobacter vallis]|uniref:AAA family ATPase n=1 Tax=Psychrobacter vallis TaxID=248451 RepID=UPI001919ECC5|nr:AAA family ATPase [Psychrobacter vallis]